ncbi:MAG TPA: carboxypeptidase regulatory-like domain-containing protein [Thermoanaerobaculia bacterium]|nr:carboxypeptidase regulatory-like domain-containing protein [Thermoanaerobaculia bacterium]
MSRNKFLILALCVLPVLAGCGGAKEETSETPAAAAAPAANAGGISGTISYAGPDTDAPIAMNADPVCASLHTTPVDTNEIAVKDGKLANVFVYVKSGLEGQTFPAPTEKVELDQQGCMYTPRVQGIQVGQTLAIKNTDATLHNVHALPTANTEFNQAQPQGIPPIEKTFDKPEVLVHVKCDVHPWMAAYLGVVSNPFYAVSGEDGSFSIKDLPPGKYTLEAVHEKLGTQTQEVTVGPSQTATVTFDFKPKA